MPTRTHMRLQSIPQRESVTVALHPPRPMPNSMPQAFSGGPALPPAAPQNHAAGAAAGPVQADSPDAQEKGAELPKLTRALMKASKRWLICCNKVPHYIGGAPRKGKLDSQEDMARLATYEDAKADVALRGADWSLGFALGPDDKGGYWQGIDFDNVAERRLADLANNVAGYVELSPSGKGCHAIGYGRHFRTLPSNSTGIEAYAAGRFFTVTENIIRDSALTCLAQYVEQSLAPRHEASRPHASIEDVPVDPKTVSELRSALWHMSADDYDPWIQMGLALRELGQTGRGLWLDWSSTSYKFDPREAAKKWDTFKPTKTGYQAVFVEAQRQGWVNPASNAAQLPRTMGSATNDNECGEGSAEEGRQIWKAIEPGLMARYCHIEMLTDDDLLALPPLRWLIKNIVPEVAFGTIHGQEKTGKSFLTLDMLAHVSNGEREWFGRKVKAAPCVYVPFEGRGGIPDRIRAWREERRKPSNIRFIMRPIDLRQKLHRDQLVETLIKRRWAGGVLCIDTLAASAGSFEENSSKDMGEMIAIFQELQQRLGGVVLVVHHSGKDPSRGMRGHSSLSGSVDFSIECLKDDQGSLFRVALMKDGEQGQVFPFVMERKWVRDDEDGEPVFSLVVRPQERVPATDAEAEMVLAVVRELGSTSQRNVIDKLGGKLPQKRVAAAIARLKVDGRIRSIAEKGKNAKIEAV